jgi:hypothetical protein
MPLVVLALLAVEATFRQVAAEVEEQAAFSSFTSA